MLPDEAPRCRPARPEAHFGVELLSRTRQHVALTPIGTAFLLEARDETLDVGFVRLPLASAAGIRAMVLGRERIIVAVPSGHPFATRSTVAVSELCDERLIMASGQENAGLASLVWRICANAGFEPTVTQTVPQIATVISLVGAGLGIALVPESLAIIRTDAVAYRYLSDVDVMSEFAMVTAAGDQTGSR
jgi:DNA-binding transcriptional LysR family regulator